MPPFINEFHYDNAGTDVGEFIEIAGLAGTDLSGYSLVLYNGNGGAVYNTLNLSGVIADQNNGYGTLGFIYPDTTQGTIQNGSPDGIALVGPGNVLIEFLSYEGTFTGVGGPANGVLSVNVGVSESGSANGTSIARIGTGTQASDFTWTLATTSNVGLVNAGQSFGGVVQQSFSINDVTVAEGNAGTVTATFTVTRSNGDTGTVTVDYATANGTATAGSDFVATSGTLTFADGETTKTISVTVNGDTDVEANETFTVNLANATGGAVIGDAQGTGTITNDDVAATPITRIYTIQGAAHVSPLLGQIVTTQGVVTAVDTNGFYLQDTTGDGDIATSDALFVFTSSRPTVAVGDLAQVRGTVSEFTPGGASTGNLSTTQLSGSLAVTVISSGNALPEAVLLGRGGRQAPTEVIDDDGLTSFDPVTDGIDFFESLEGMLVTVPSPLAVSGTNQFGEIYTVADEGADATNLSSRGTINVDGLTTGGLNNVNSGPGSDFNPERIQIDADTGVTPGIDLPLVNVGTVLNDVTGVISYNFGNFEVVPTSQVTVREASTLAPEVTELAGDDTTLTIASYNVLNLDPNDNDGNPAANVARDFDVADGRFTAIAQQIVNNLKAPDIIALAEVQDNSGSSNDGTVAANVTLQMLVDAIVAAGGPTYSFIDNPFVVDGQVGGAPGGNIRNAFLYNDARVDLVAGSVRTTPDALADFAGSRVPLVADFAFGGEEFTVVANHFSSKGGGTPLFGVTQPAVDGSAGERLVQAQNVADFVASLGPDANVVVLGDLNEFETEEALEPLTTTGGLTNLTFTLPEEERYSFIFDGNSQPLDHIFVSGNLAPVSTLDEVHINTEFAVTPSSASDHDPSVVAISVAPRVFTLQLLHFADGEAGLLASQTAPNLAALVDAFEDDYVNSITLAGGDNFIPGPFFAAGADPAILSVLPGGNVQGRVDIAIHNAIGVQASTIGNHEFDFGSQGFADAFRPSGAWTGALFPYLSANLDFSGDAVLRGAFTETLGVNGLEQASANNGRIVPSAVITENGEPIGIIGVTTQLLEQISSPTGTEVKGFPFGPGANGEFDNMALLAQQLQPYIDDLRDQGVNKIILMSHLQLLNNERALAQLLEGVDIILAAGSNTRLGDADDEAVAFPGHAADFADTYPIVTAGTDGRTTLIVNTDNEYTYLGRLVVDFDENGEIILDSIADNVAINGAYASTTENVAEAWGDLDGDLSDSAFAEGTRGESVQDLTDAVQAVIDVKSANVFGYSDVYHEGARAKVRNEETNLGSVSADANADAARDALGLAPTDVVVSLKNGGGIRSQIGTVSAPKADGTVDFLPNPGGVVSQLDVENSLRFNNALMVFETTPQGLLNILNNPAGLTPNNGGFIQIGGLQFSYDPSLPAGQRVRDIALVDENGNKVAAIANDGVVLPGAPASITMVTLNFTAQGGDGFPVKANGENFRYLLADGTVSGTVPESANFTDAATIATYAGGAANLLGEQQAFADYFRENFGTPEEAFDLAETDQTGDLRIQNQAVRADTVLVGDTIEGTSRSDTLEGGSFNDTINGGAGRDTLIGNGGDDVLNGGAGRDMLIGGTGNDTYFVDSAFGEVVEAAGEGTDTVISTVSQTLGDNIENGQILGDKNLRLTGNDLDNQLVGNAGNNRIEGLGGDDVILAGAGNDQLFGGLGADILTGGAGSDRFTSTDVAESTAGARDLITDFVSGEDRINLVQIDPTETGARSAFRFIGDAEFGNVEGELRAFFDGTQVIVQGDVDGDGVADIEIAVLGVASLAASDFQL